MEFDTQVKLAIYRHFAEMGRGPSPEEIAERVGSDDENVLASYHRLRTQRLLVLNSDGVSIRMAPPFSGVPTQHVVEADGIQYFANCAWDSLGILAALQKPGVVHSRCEQSGTPLHLNVAVDGPEPSDWLFHCLVPVSQW